MRDRGRCGGLGALQLEGLAEARRGPRGVMKTTPPSGVAATLVGVEGAATCGVAWASDEATLSPPGPTAVTTKWRRTPLARPVTTCGLTAPAILVPAVPDPDVAEW